MRESGFVRVNFSLPQSIYVAFKMLVPERKRSSVVTSLIQMEIKKMERALYKAAKAVEKDAGLNKEMQAWDDTLADGWNSCHPRTF